MDRVVYDAFRTGQDGQYLSLIALIIFADILIVLYVLTVVKSRAKRNGPVTSNKLKMDAIENNVATDPYPFLRKTGVWSFLFITPLLLIYSTDRVSFTKGRYRTVVGNIENDRVVRLVVQKGRNSLIDQVALHQPQQQEWDQLTINGIIFVVECVRPAEASPGVIGIAGACLDQVQTGSKVRVDYFPSRSEPIRITLLN